MASPVIDPEKGRKCGFLLFGIARWLAYAGLALLVGTAFFAVSCWPGGESTSGIHRLLWTGWVTLLAATLATFVLYGPVLTGGSLDDSALFGVTLGSRLGIMLMIRVVLLILVAAALVWLRRSAPFQDYAGYRRRRGGVVLAAGAALAVTWGLANHSAAGTQVALTLPMDTIHLLAMAVWLGGLPVLLGVLLRSGDVAGMRTAVPRFSRTALVCVAVLVVTGTYQARRAVGSPAALFGTTYGTVLMVKVGIVAVLVLLGALARGWVLAIIDGLDDAVLTTAVGPLGWTPLGMVEHLGHAERHWFQEVVTGSAEPLAWPDENTPLNTTRPPDVVFAFYRDQRARADAIIADTPLDAPPKGSHPAPLGDEVTDLRWVILHMIEETARHAGHLDIVRELIDGATGLGPR